MDPHPQGPSQAELLIGQTIGNYLVTQKLGEGGMGAVYLAEHPALSAAVINLRLGDDTTAGVCRRLSHLGIPFMFHTRYDTSEASRTWPEAPVVSKPADSAVVVSTVATLVH